MGAVGGAAPPALRGGAGGCLRGGGGDRPRGCPAAGGLRRGEGGCLAQKGDEVVPLVVVYWRCGTPSFNKPEFALPARASGRVY